MPWIGKGIRSPQKLEREAQHPNEDAVVNRVCDHGCDQRISPLPQYRKPDTNRRKCRNRHPALWMQRRKKSHLLKWQRKETGIFHASIDAMHHERKALQRAERNQTRAVSITIARPFRLRRSIPRLDASSAREVAPSPLPHSPRPESFPEKEKAVSTQPTTKVRPSVMMIPTKAKVATPA